MTTTFFNCLKIVVVKRDSHGLEANRMAPITVVILQVSWYELLVY